jgi:hypothetical protein
VSIKALFATALPASRLPAKRRPRAVLAGSVPLTEAAAFRHSRLG